MCCCMRLLTALGTCCLPMFPVQTEKLLQVADELGGPEAVFKVCGDGRCVGMRGSLLDLAVRSLPSHLAAPWTLLPSMCCRPSLHSAAEWPAHSSAIGLRF